MHTLCNKRHNILARTLPDVDIEDYSDYSTHIPAEFKVIANIPDNG